MLYFVIHPSGQRFGPADVPTLSQWAAEGRLAPTSLVAEQLSGRQLQAQNVPGIMFPGQMGTGQMGPGQMGPGPMGYAQPPSQSNLPYSLTGNYSPNQGYGNPGNPYSTPSPHNPYSVMAPEGTDQLNLSYILSGVSIGLQFVCCVPLMGVISILCAIAGLITAIIAHTKGARAGGAITLAVVALAIPFVLGMLAQMFLSSFGK